jgi:RNA recognition motif-containing protein
MRLYVGNLPFNFTPEDLNQMFAGYGEISSADIVSDRDTGRSRGFGFVELASEEAGRRAIAELDGSEQGGRRAVVNEARPRQERRPRG